MREEGKVEEKKTIRWNRFVCRLFGTCCLLCVCSQSFTPALASHVRLCCRACGRERESVEVGDDLDRRAVGIPGQSTAGPRTDLTSSLSSLHPPSPFSARTLVLCVCVY